MCSVNSSGDQCFERLLCLLCAAARQQAPEDRGRPQRTGGASARPCIHACSSCPRSCAVCLTCQLLRLQSVPAIKPEPTGGAVKEEALQWEEAQALQEDDDVQWEDAAPAPKTEAEAAGAGGAAYCQRCELHVYPYSSAVLRSSRIHHAILQEPVMLATNWGEHPTSSCQRTYMHSYDVSLELGLHVAYI